MDLFGDYNRVSTIHRVIYPDSEPNTLNLIFASLALSVIKRVFMGPETPKIEEVIYKKTTREPNSECPICFETFERGTKISKTVCDHFFLCKLSRRMD